MQFLVTAGPTREYLDPVRFLSNGSTGTMGYACAEAAVRRGHRAVLVSGPTGLAKPKGVKRIDVISAKQMLQAMLEQYDHCDCVIMTAAVCDYQPIKQSRNKIKKTEDSLQLELEHTPDILAELGRLKMYQTLIGFAVEDRSAKTNARRKLKTKNLDAIVLNSPAAFGADRSEVQLLCHGDKWQSLGIIRKTSLATQLIRLAELLVKKKTIS